MYLTTSGVWTEYTIAWLILCLFVVLWHISAYVRVSVASISRAVPFTIAGVLIAMALTASAIALFDIHQAVVVAGIVLPGYAVAILVSVRLHDAWPRKHRRPIGKERAPDPEMGRKHAWNQAMVKRRKKKDFVRATLEK